MRKPVSYTLKESDLLAARQKFREQESRDLFYRAATELVRLALDGQTSISVAEALGTLLQTWNKSFYRFHGKFDEAHFQALESVVEEGSEKWQQWRGRSIETLGDDEQNDISETFAALETVIGPVGAAKAMHLLSPEFFPLWDRTIASKYGVSLKPRGENAPAYLRFMEITKQQVSGLGNTELRSQGILKLIDEYNYSVFTKGWLVLPRPAK
jgi:hypothetical protein